MDLKRCHLTCCPMPFTGEATHNEITDTEHHLMEDIKDFLGKVKFHSDVGELRKGVWDKQK